MQDLWAIQIFFNMFTDFFWADTKNTAKMNLSILVIQIKFNP